MNDNSGNNIAALDEIFNAYYQNPHEYVIAYTVQDNQQVMSFLECKRSTVNPFIIDQDSTYSTLEAGRVKGSIKMVSEFQQLD